MTNGQYVQFLNAVDPSGSNTLGLFNSNMGTNENGGITSEPLGAAGSKYALKSSGRAAQPVIFVSFYDSIRFANWLNNGQGSGSTETGAYTLLGGTPTPSNGSSITRNASASVFLPSQNEWYKAAYYKGGGTNAGFWDYATQSDTLPTSDQPPGATATNSQLFQQ